MISINDIIQRSNFVIRNSLHKSIGLFRLHGHGNKRVFKSHQSCQTFKHTVSKTKINHSIFSVRSSDHTAFHLIIRFPVIFCRIRNRDLFSPLCNIIHNRIIYIRHSRTATCRRIFPFDPKTIHAVAKLCTFFNCRSIDCSKTKYLVSDK